MNYLFITIILLSTSLSFSQNVVVPSQDCFRYFKVNRASLTDILKSQDTVNYQNHIWDYRAKVQGFNADKLETALEDLMREGVVHSDELVDIGKSGARLIRLENEVQGIFKTSESWASNVSSEVAAFKLDRLLGLDLVPVTVKRKINGEVGSLQLFVRDAKMAKDVNLELSLNIKNSKAKLEILDYLLLNSDRNTSNYLFTKKGKMVAIDHGLALNNSDIYYKKYQRPTFSNEVIQFFKNEEGKSLVIKLKSISDKSLKRELKETLKKKDIKGIVLRKDTILKQFSN